MSSGIDITRLQAWVGKTTDALDDLPVWKAQALAAALDRDWVPQRGDALPACWQWIYFVEAPKASATGVDGHPATGGFLPPVPLPRRMWAAGAFEVPSPLVLGESARKVSEIQAVELKQGKTGDLVFVTVEHRLSQGDTLCIRETQNIVYRAMPDGPAPLPPGKPVDIAATSAPFQPDPVLLFRYSALTYNGHRIHYDRDYATGAEHYPALVVHGPLLATLLAGRVERDDADARLTRFSFRAQRPAFDTDALTLNRVDEADGLRLYTRSADGFLGMSATAQWLPA